MKPDTELHNIVRQLRRRMGDNLMVADLCDKAIALEKLALAGGAARSSAGCPVCEKRRKKDKARVDRFRKRQR